MGDPTVVRPGVVPRWVSISGLALSLFGLAISVYLAFEGHNGDSAVACPSSSIINCQKVTESSSADVFGVPVPLLGLMFFLFAAILNVPAAWRSSVVLLHAERMAMMLGGVGFAIYLIYAELFVVNAICLWCTGVHLVTVLLFGVTVHGTVHLIEGRSTS
jgi:uncharacterized membrane protein